MRSSNRLASPQILGDSSLIKLKNNDWLERQRVAGKVVAGALSLLKNQVDNGTTQSMIELNSLAEEFILDNKCDLTFKNYKGFPNGVCISINKMLVHGIATDYKLQDGDLVSFDLGATFKDAVADAAITCIYGNPKSDKHIKLIKATEDSLAVAISAIAVGKRLGCIGEAIYKHASSAGFNVITNYGGHGLDWDTPHSAPFIENKSSSNKGIRIQPNLSICIEPMLTIGSTNTRVDKDGWSVMCEAEMSAHFEHTLYIHENSVEIITDRNNL